MSFNSNLLFLGFIFAMEQCNSAGIPKVIFPLDFIQIICSLRNMIDMSYGS